jgi:DinB family protein
MIGIAEVLLLNLRDAYDGKGWHGPTLRGALRGVKEEAAMWRPQDPRHNISELTMHCAYWKYAARRKLTGEKRGSFPVKGSNWFVADTMPWRDVVKLLDEQHALLRKAIESLPKSAFEDRKRLRLIYGVAAHDLYHAGQIRLLRRLQRS